MIFHSWKLKVTHCFTELFVQARWQVLKSFSSDEWLIEFCIIFIAQLFHFFPWYELLDFDKWISLQHLYRCCLPQTYLFMLFSTTITLFNYYTLNSYNLILMYSCMITALCSFLFLLSQTKIQNAVNHYPCCIWTNCMTVQQFSAKQKKQKQPCSRNGPHLSKTHPKRITMVDY